MFFFNSSFNPLLAFLQGGTTFQGGMEGPLAPGNPFDLHQLNIMRAQMLANQAGAQYQKNLMNAQAMFSGRGGIPPSVDPEPETVELKQLKALPQYADGGVGENQRWIDSSNPLPDPLGPHPLGDPDAPKMKDVTPPDQDFECAGCGHPGPKDRLNGCQVCGGMVWK